MVFILSWQSIILWLMRGMACRFWKYPLPDLPPKLQPVDAVLVEDVGGRLGASGLQRVLAQTPQLLNPGGVCVVVLSGQAGGSRDRCTADSGSSGAGRGSLEASRCPLGDVSGVTQPDGSGHQADGPQQIVPDVPDDELGHWTGRRAAAASMPEVCRWLQEAGLQFVKEERTPYPVFGSSSTCCTRLAHAGVWVQPSLT
jgi:hypothetical protein